LEYHPGHDYRSSLYAPVDGEPLLTLKAAGNDLGVSSEQVRRLIAAGQLPSWRGASGRGHHRVPVWAIEGLMAARASAAASPGTINLSERVGRLEALIDGGYDDTKTSTEAGLLREVARLRAENATLRDSESLLALAAESEHEAADALSRVVELAKQTVDAYADAERHRASAAKAYNAALAAYRLPGHPGDAR
jgi:hypothetical protein